MLRFVVIKHQDDNLLFLNEIRNEIYRHLLIKESFKYRITKQHHKDIRDIFEILKTI